MDVVDTWTGRHARALRRALRLSNEAFAERLGTGVRTVATWNADPKLIPTTEIQRALDTVLSQSSADDRARFSLLLSAGAPTPPEPPRDLDPEIADRLDRDPDIGAALDWLDQHAAWQFGDARKQVGDLLRRLDFSSLRERGYQRGQVQRSDLAHSLLGYYGEGDDQHGVYRATCGGEPVVTTMLTRREWLDLAVPLQTENDALQFVGPASHTSLVLDAGIARAAAERLAEALVVKTRLVNAPIYQLSALRIDDGTIGGSVQVADFVSYALTMDLLESELVDSIVSGREVRPGNLPIRDRLLPDIAAVTDIARRVCAGGPPTLCAIARSNRKSRRPGSDYVLLVQERSGRVLNAAQRLAVIPKAFHGPLADYDEDAQLGATIEREMEEELFGRDDVDSTLGSSRGADPMHPTRLTPPMRWLAEHDDGRHWRKECTAFGFNLISGNYEFASLIVIEDEEWWATFGGQVEANWESDSLQTFSTLNHDLIGSLINDPRWSNEGVFSLLQGLRRLRLISPDRLNIPDIGLDTNGR